MPGSFIDLRIEAWASYFQACSCSSCSPGPSAYSTHFLRSELLSYTFLSASGNCPCKPLPRSAYPDSSGPAQNLAPAPRTGWSAFTSSCSSSEICFWVESWVQSLLCFSSRPRQRLPGCYGGGTGSQTWSHGFVWLIRDLNAGVINRFENPCFGSGSNLASHSQCFHFFQSLDAWLAWRCSQCDGLWSHRLLNCPSTSREAGIAFHPIAWWAHFWGVSQSLLYICILCRWLSMTQFPVPSGLKHPSMWLLD